MVKKSPNPDAKFRLNCKMFLLTYSTGEAPDLFNKFALPDLHKHLIDTFEHRTYITTCRELCPTTGNVHFHAYVELSIKCDIKSRNQLLFNGVGINVVKG